MPRHTAIAALAAAAGLAAVLAPAPARAQKAADDLPGVDLSALTPAQVEVVQRVAREQFCHCGCPHTLGGCLREHSTCKHAPRMASLAARLAGQGLPAAQVGHVLGEYYASFDRVKRAKLDVKSFGPPLGKPEAPITIVEFSDFTCPYCQALQPVLERFVRENEGRVKLYYKPFPISSHARSLEAALAAEWARDEGIFWKMHAALFEHPHALSDDDLASTASDVGGDPDSLRKALEQGRDRARVAASQAEARAAGLQGTPTLFFNGRRLDVPSSPADMAELLRFTLEDEEEWSKAGGWGKD
jgi:protein-disulfide isomerase